MPGRQGTSPAHNRNFSLVPVKRRQQAQEGIAEKP